MNIRPLNERVVVKLMDAEEVSKGGILLPDTAKEKSYQGKVVAVGPGRLTDEGKRLPLDLKVGDEILYSKYSGTEVKYGGEELLVLNGEHDILAVIERK